MSIEMLSRRSLFHGVVLAAVAAAVGFVAARQSAAAKPKAGTTAANAYGAVTGSGGSRLAALAAVPEGGGLVVSAAHVVLTRDAQGTVHAFSATCTHQGCTVAGVHGGHITCPCHGSVFDASTGAVVSGPAPRPLPKVAVVVQGDDIFST
jgi:Rieske Fe-S protein